MTAAAAALRELRGKIRENGWVVTGIGESSDLCAAAGCSHGHGPSVPHDPRLYTAGLTVAGLPELLLEHVPSAAAYPVLQALAKWSLATELQPGVPVRIANLGMFTVTKVPPAEGRRLCGVARKLYGDGIRVLRVERADALAGPSARGTSEGGPPGG